MTKRTHFITEVALDCALGGVGRNVTLQVGRLKTVSSVDCNSHPGPTFTKSTIISVELFNSPISLACTRDCDTFLRSVSDTKSSRPISYPSPGGLWPLSWAPQFQGLHNPTCRSLSVPLFFPNGSHEPRRNHAGKSLHYRA